MPEEFAHQLGNQNLGSTKGVLRGHGLQHAREFLKTIGGGISFSSKLGWGTIAYVWIPKSQLKAAGLNKA
jgi:signal transduction histidine kinase